MCSSQLCSWQMARCALKTNSLLENKNSFIDLTFTQLNQLQIKAFSFRRIYSLLKSTKVSKNTVLTTFFFIFHLLKWLCLTATKTICGFRGYLHGKESCIVNLPVGRISCPSSYLICMPFPGCTAVIELPIISCATVPHWSLYKNNLFFRTYPFDFPSYKFLCTCWFYAARRWTSDRFWISDFHCIRSPVSAPLLLFTVGFLHIKAHLGCMAEVTDACTRMLSASDRS